MIGFGSTAFPKPAQAALITCSRAAISNGRTVPLSVTLTLGCAITGTPTVPAVAP